MNCSYSPIFAAATLSALIFVIACAFAPSRAHVKSSTGPDNVSCSYTTRSPASPTSAFVPYCTTVLMFPLGSSTANNAFCAKLSAVV
jgi:hypothetical protein